MSKLSTESYKGVRDFYPEDEFIQRYIKDTWREVCELYGYEAYDASVLEPLELYKAKTSAEIVNEQTYNFTDRGEREVTLRPEMTPTVARLVAARSRELGFPLRLYSIPNLFRYERPQRGRLREHWQLNCDLFGLGSIEADIEIITLAVRLLEAFGLTQDQFEVRVSSRDLLQRYFDKYNLSKSDQQLALRLIDRWHKDDSARVELEKLLHSTYDLEPDEGLNNLIERLGGVGINNVVFDRTLARGFDYYTGLIFEVFDKHPDNNRSILGGGRYDKLIDNFGIEPIPTVGFGLGDVVMRDVLDTYDLLPTYEPATDLCLISLSEAQNQFVLELAESLRQDGLSVETDTSNRKTATGIKQASKRKTPFIAVIGDNEAKGSLVTLKHLVSGHEINSPTAEISPSVQNFLFEQK